MIYRRHPIAPHWYRRADLADRYLQCCDMAA